MVRKPLPDGGKFKMRSGAVFKVPKTLKKGIPKETWQRLNYNLSSGKASPVDFGDVASMHSKADRHDKSSIARELQATAYLHNGEATDAVWSLDLASHDSEKHAIELKRLATEVSNQTQQEKYLRGSKYWDDRALRMKALADTWEKHDPTKLARSKPRSPGQPK